VTVLLVTDPRFLDHDTGRRHPESPARLGAVLDAVAGAIDDGALVPIEPRLATGVELGAVHHAEMLVRIEEACAAGARLDPDTVAVPASWEAARLAAGAGLTAVETLEAGGYDAAFCAVRPPGHHATSGTPMGFCLMNNIAVTARALADRGERVLIADVDAHHGNGTQDVFYDDPRVLFVSWHQWPLYPGTGRMDENGTGAGVGATINIPLPPGATGDRYRRALDGVVAAAIGAFDPTWLLISAGFDGHRDDPLTSLGLTSGDYAALLATLVPVVPPGRVVAFLEGGYDLDALGRCAAACIAVLSGDTAEAEPQTTGGPGGAAVDGLEAHWRNGESDLSADR
jgi:acetoin utilization deacetylase AcuC-like enzyme